MFIKKKLVTRTNRQIIKKNWYIKILIKLLKHLLLLVILIVRKTFIYFFILILFIWFAWWSSKTPSLNREWAETEKILPTISFSGSDISIKNVRNFKHISSTESIPGYYDEVYDLEKIESVYYIIEPFSEYDWPAHTMLSFGFSDWKYVTVSAEIRKEKWEWFDPILWLMNQFEMVYIIWDENDLIKLRANIRKDVVRLYPMNVWKEEIKSLFSSMMYRADKLSKEPEFYNTFWNTCTTSILNHVNNLKNDKISWFDLRILLPSNSDKIAFDLWLIDTNFILEHAREYYTINSLSELYWFDENYSKYIRKEIK